MPFDIGFGEILVVLIVALLVFGGRLPEVGRSLGRSLAEFRRGLTEMREDLAEEEDLPDGGESEEGARPDPGPISPSSP